MTFKFFFASSKRCVLALHVRAATALAEPFRGAGQVVKELILVSEHERRALELALALDPRLGLASQFALVLTALRSPSSAPTLGLSCAASRGD